MLPKPVRRALKKNWGLLIVLRFRSVFLPQTPSSPLKKQQKELRRPKHFLPINIINLPYHNYHDIKKTIIFYLAFWEVFRENWPDFKKILIDKKKKTKNLYFLPPTPTFVQLLIINLQLIFKSDNQLIIKTHWA